MSKILITGGAGFIGYHLAKHLATESDNEIVITDKRIPTEDLEFMSLLSKSNVKTLEVDLSDATASQGLGCGFDYVYHLASINGFKQFNEIPHEVLRIGITSTINVLDWLCKTNNNPKAKILYVSSNETYLGAREAFDILPIPTPENVPLVIVDPYNPRWSYAGSKIIGEQFFIHYAKAYNFPMVIARLQSVYGPRAGFHPLIPKIIGRIMEHKEPFPLQGPGDKHSFCFVEDVVDALRILNESPTTNNKTYNVGSSSSTSIEEITNILFDLADWHPKQMDISPSFEGGVAESEPDISKIKNCIGWTPKTDIKDGLRKTFAWYKEHQDIYLTH